MVDQHRQHAIKRPVGPQQEVAVVAVAVVQQYIQYASIRLQYLRVHAPAVLRELLEQITALQQAHRM